MSIIYISETGKLFDYMGLTEEARIYKEVAMYKISKR